MLWEEQEDVGSSMDDPRVGNGGWKLLAKKGYSS